MNNKISTIIMVWVLQFLLYLMINIYFVLTFPCIYLIRICNLPFLQLRGYLLGIFYYDFCIFITWTIFSNCWTCPLYQPLIMNLFTSTQLLRWNLTGAVKVSICSETYIIFICKWCSRATLSTIITCVLQISN